MRWPWQHKETVKTVFVPIPAFGEHSKLWDSKGYLQDVINITSSQVYIVEMTQLLKELRDLADASESVDRLKGINDAIALVKDRIVASNIAILKLESIRQEEAAKEMIGVING